MQGKTWRAEREGENEIITLYTEKEISYYPQNVFFSTYGEKSMSSVLCLFILFIAFIDLCY